MNQKLLKNILPALLFAFMSLAAVSIVACGTRGDGENAGEKVDETLEDAKEGAEDVFDNDGPVEDAGEKVDDAVE